MGYGFSHKKKNGQLLKCEALPQYVPVMLP